MFGGVDAKNSVVSTEQFTTQPEEREKIHIVLTSASNADICISSGLDADTDYTWKSDDYSLAVMVEDGSNTPQGQAAAVLGVDVTKP